MPEYILLRLPLLRDPNLPDGKRTGVARLLSLLAALLQLFGKRNGRLRADAGGDGLDKLARDTRIGRCELLEPLLDKFYHHRWAPAHRTTRHGWPARPEGLHSSACSSCAPASLLPCQLLYRASQT